MKKILALVLVLVTVMSLAACSGYNGKSSGDIMTYSEYNAAQNGSKVVIEAYVQGTDTWIEKDGQGVVSVFTQDHDGAYYVYEMVCPKEKLDDLYTGTKVRITGTKNVVDGIARIDGATYEVIEGMWKAPVEDVTSILGDEAKIKEKLGRSVVIKDVVVDSVVKTGGMGSDIKLTVSAGDQKMDLLVDGSRFNVHKSYEGQVAYNAIANMEVGTVVDLSGMLYWVDGAQLANLSITQKTAE